MRDNIKNLHRNSGIVRLLIDNKIQYQNTYTSFSQRCNIINGWTKGLKKDYVIEIIPNWDIWNGKY